MSMLESGNWILPVNFGQDLAYKPPLLAWLIAGLSWLFNGGYVTEYLSRLPSALAAIAMIMGGFFWSRRLRGDRFALVMAIVTITSFEVFRAAMACRVDMVLTACMVLPMYILFDILEYGRGRSHGVAWTCACLILSGAVLTKGPVGSLLPCATMGAYYLLRGQRFLPTFFRMLGLALAAMILPAAWYYAAWCQGGDAFLDLMLEENLGRLTGTMSYESHEQPFYYNFVTIIAGCLPWTLATIFAAFSIRKWRRTPLTSGGLMALTAVVVIVGFYCIPSSKRSVYLLPAYPFLCYAITSIIESEAARKPVRVFTWLIAVLALIIPPLFIVLEVVRPDGIELTAPNWYGWLALIPPFVLGIAWIVNRHSPSGHLLLTIWSLYLAYIACIMPAVLNPRSDKNLMSEIASDTQTQILILENEQPVPYRLYTLDFYYKDSLRPVHSVAGAAAYPAGTVVLIPQISDTTGLSRYFDYKPLTHRSCDHRGPLGVAVRKAELIQTPN